MVIKNIHEFLKHNLNLRRIPSSNFDTFEVKGDYSHISVAKDDSYIYVSGGVHFSRVEDSEAFKIIWPLAQKNHLELLILTPNQGKTPGTYKFVEPKAKTASSQVAWALLTEGVTKSRVEVHRLSQMVDRVMKLVDNSSEEDKERLYQAAGDIIVAFPDKLEKIGVALDSTSLALARMGEEFLESRLPVSEKTKVDEAVKPAGGKVEKSSSLAKRVAEKYLD